MVDETKQPQGGVVGNDDKGLADDAGSQRPPQLDVRLPNETVSEKEDEGAQVIFDNQGLSLKSTLEESRGQEKTGDKEVELEGSEEEKKKDLSAGLEPRKQEQEEDGTLEQEENQNQPMNQDLRSESKVVEEKEKKEEGGESKEQEEEEQNENGIRPQEPEKGKEEELEKQVEELVALVGDKNRAQAHRDQGELNEGDEKSSQEKVEKESEKGEEEGGQIKKAVETTASVIKQEGVKGQTSEPVTPNPDDFQKDKFGSVTYDFTDEDEGEEEGFWGKGMVGQTNEETTQTQKPGMISEGGGLQEKEPVMEGESELETVKEEKTEGLKEESERVKTQGKTVGSEGEVGEQPSQATDLLNQKGEVGEGGGKEKMGEDKRDENKNWQDQNKEVGVQVSESGQEEGGLGSRQTTDLKEAGKEGEETTNKDEVPPTPPPSAEDLKPAAAEPPKKPFHWVRWVSVGLSILIVIGIGVFIWQKIKGKSKENLKPRLTEVKPEPKTSNVKLVYWGLWEDGQIMKPLLDKFKKETGVRVEYVQKNPRNYRLALESAIKEGKGPDVFRFHNTWVPMLKEELDNVPANIYSADEFAKTFYPVAVKDLTWQGRLKGVPLEIDGLVLYYNKDLLAKAGLDKDLPTNWDALAKQAKQLTTYREGGKINIAGVALGTVNNVDHWSDIVGLMFYQNGVEMARLDTSLDAQGRNLAADVLRYYTHFVTGSKPTWSEDLPPSTVMFGSGRLAFYFGPSWRAFEFAKNGINFGIINVPKIPGDSSEWASYWVEGVSVKSKHKKEAWKLIKFLSQPQNLRLFFNEAKKHRLFGEPYARQDMREELAKDPYLSALAAAAPNMKSYYFASFTHDQGLNDRVNDALGLGITQVLSGKKPEEAIKEVKKKIDQILASYGAKE